jgi:hypothetical protein
MRPRGIDCLIIATSVVRFSSLALGRNWFQYPLCEVCVSRAQNCGINASILTLLLNHRQKDNILQMGVLSKSVTASPKSHSTFFRKLASSMLAN